MKVYRHGYQLVTSPLFLIARVTQIHDPSSPGSTAMDELINRAMGPNGSMELPHSICTDVTTRVTWRLSYSALRKYSGPLEL